MSSTIPPLVCDTPPPIDFDNDDDFGGFETNDGQYDDGKHNKTEIEKNLQIL